MATKKAEKEEKPHVRHCPWCGHDVTSISPLVTSLCPMCDGDLKKENVPEQGSLTELSDDALAKEIARREEVKTRKLIKENRERLAKLQSVLTMDIIDALMPTHGRTSCSNQDPSNGFGSNGMYDQPRCNKCALIELMNSRWADIPPGYLLHFEVSLLLSQVGKV